jgi:hypothetical protein
VERSGSAESLNAVFHFAVVVIPLFIKRGGSEADGVFKMPFVVFLLKTTKTY